MPLRCRGPARRSSLRLLPRCAEVMRASGPGLETHLCHILSRMKTSGLPNTCLNLTLRLISRTPTPPPLYADHLLAAATGKSTGCESMQVGQHALIKADDCLSAVACSRTVMPCCLFCCSLLRDQRKGPAFWESTPGVDSSLVFVFLVFF